MSKNKKIEFNHDWQFYKGKLTEDMSDVIWQSVILPHSWNEEDMCPGTKDVYIGEGWYKKDFSLSEKSEDDRILIEFEAIAMSSKIWVDGTYVSGRRGGFLGNCMDITDALADTEVHTITVCADNSYDKYSAMPEFIDWERYGGIYRDAWIHTKKAAYLTYKGIAVRQQTMEEKSSLAITAEVSSYHIAETEYTVKITLLDKGLPIKSVENKVSVKYWGTKVVVLSMKDIEKPHLWSSEDPYLYTLKTELFEHGVLMDTDSQQIGLRYFVFDKDKGFSLNGKSMKLRGVNHHQEFGGLGHSTPHRFHQMVIKQMKDMGINYVRGSHYPRNEYFLQECDRNGILVMEEQPLWHGSLRAMQGELFLINIEKQIREMVRQHGNHPSIIAWNTANEVMLAPVFERGVGHAAPNDPRREKWKITQKDIPYIKRALALCYKVFKEIDPDRYVSYVIGGMYALNQQYLLTDITDMVAYNGGTVHNMNYFDAETGKTYPLLIDKMREQYPQRIALLSEGVINYQNTVSNESIRGNWNLEYTQWEVNATYWSLFYERDWFCGGSMWAFAEYYANGVVRGRGVLDSQYLPLETYHFYCAMWSKKPVIHILGHWDENRNGTKEEIVVFTNGTDLKLTLNDRELKGDVPKKFLNLPNAPIVFKNVKYEVGELRAIAEYKAEIIEDKRITSSKPSQILLVADQEIISADGREVSFVTATITDNNGNRCYTAENEISLEIEGVAVLKCNTKRVVQAGKLRFAVRSNGEQGQVVIKAKGEGLKKGQVVVVCKNENL